MTSRGSQVRSLSRPPPTLCSCKVSSTLAIAPQSQRHVCQIRWLARSLLLQLSRMSPFRRPVSAANNSVPDSSFGDWFDLCVGSWRLGPRPVLPNLRMQNSQSHPNRPFLRGFRRHYASLPDSVDFSSLSRRFLVSKKFHSRRPDHRVRSRQDYKKVATRFLTLRVRKRSGSHPSRCNARERSIS